MNARSKLVEMLARSAMCQDYERAYADATGMPVALRSVETWQLPFLGKQKENVFCARMAENSHTCAACLHETETPRTKEGSYEMQPGNRVWRPPFSGQTTWLSSRTPQTC